MRARRSDSDHARAASSRDSPAEKVAQVIRNRARDGLPALLAFFTAGHPDRTSFATNLTRIANAADVVEIGVPFSDPMADGVSIQRSSRIALANGASLAWIFSELSSLSPRPRAPLVLMSYANPLLAFGVERLAEQAAKCGVSGFIVPDLALEESTPWRDAFDAAGVALVQLVSPLTPDERLRAICAASRGFVYAVTTAGTTGSSDALPPELPAYLARVRAASSLPVCAGFGIRRAEQVRALATHADGVIVGSALVEALERGDDAESFLRSLRARA
jgi:tryptophan synthase alpha chain